MQNARFIAAALTIGVALAATMSGAEKLQLIIGQPFAVLGTQPTTAAAAANMKTNAKNAALAVRADGCSDPSTLRLTATAEGTAAGKRRTAPLAVMPAAPGTFTIARPPDGGAWVVSLVATCGKLIAGGLVPLMATGTGFERERSTFYDRAPTAGEIDKAVMANGAEAAKTQKP
jgi:hypothetical protein